jgi:hypothetical protein
MESLLPQWKCNCANKYLPLRGPPETEAVVDIFICSITEMLREHKADYMRCVFLTLKCYVF